MNDKLIEKIISTAYGDAGLIDKLHIYILSLRNREVRELLNEYRSTARAVHSAKEEELPEDKTEMLYALAGGRRRTKTAFLFDILSIFTAKPVVASVTAFAVMALVITTMFVKNPQPETVYSDEEIINAAAQTKQVFQILNEAFDHAKVVVEDKVLKENVAKPINESYKKITRIIKEGEVK
jgi:cytochrome c1